ncbi:MAG: PIN domain-containing protein [Deltaproteobacteria bacterium]|nr:PIN domain-containing protein [Deltaproteobacteria bacterium]
MNENKPVIVDTNILISILLRKKSTFLETLRSAKYQFYICESTIIELFKHKDRIIEYSELSEDKITKVYYFLLKRVNIFKEDLIEKSNWERAYKLCKDVDETDTPFVALTLELNGLLYSGDKKLKNHLKRKGLI